MTKNKLFPVLSGAPIILAVMQMRFTLKTINDKNAYNAIHKRVSDRFPKFEQTKSAQLQFNPLDQKTPISMQLLDDDSFNYFTEDNKIRFTVSNSTFIFQSGGLYSTWDDFFEIAWWAWQKCGFENQIKSIFWYSLRYINNFELQATKEKILEPSEYFKSYPELPNKDQNYTRFLLQYSTPVEPPFYMVNVGIESRETMTEIFPFIFDIDAICQEVGDYSSEKTRDIFTNLRHYKNDVFFNNLTEKTIKLFK